MSTRHYRKKRGKKSRCKRMSGGTKCKTAMSGGQSKNKKTLRKQALINARKLFGSL